MTQNPNISHINKDSHFIYDDMNSIDYFNKLKNKNIIKPSEKEIIILQKFIEDINNHKSVASKNESFIEIPENMANKLKQFIPKPISENSELLDFIVATLNENKTRQGISCRKLASLYENKYNKKVSKSTIHRLLRKKLNLKYLKTTYKTKKIESAKNKSYCFYFIKAFIKFIKVGFEFIFIDESKFETQNNHFRCWRAKEESLCFGPENKSKKNITLAIGKSMVLF